jgi:cytoskeletal protein RodZ
MLRQARLDRGASLADVEAETRIRRRYLEALEAEDYASLPATVYTRGFIRSYARYLGLDPELALDLYGPARGREERPSLRPATAQLTAARPVSTRLFALAAVVVLVGLLLIYLWTQYTSFVESISGQEPAATRLAGTATIRVASSPSPVAAVTPTATAAPLAAAPEASPTPERGIVIEARVTERTWMEVWVDGTSQLQATMQAGAVRSFTAERSIRMRVGNAGGVQVTVNGQPAGPLGDKNQVKDLVWER